MREVLFYLTRVFRTKEEAAEFDKFESKHPEQKLIKRLQKEIAQAEKRILLDFKRQQKKKIKEK